MVNASGFCASSTWLLSFVCLVFLQFVCAEKYKVCVVDGRGGFRKSGRYCPILDGPDSKVECVLGLDRLDCLRKIHKGKADFSVFTAEDLVTASNSKIEILLTNEMRFTKDDYEYEIVAVVNNAARIKSREDLRDKKFCHPGYGYEAYWTRILSNYLEASVVPQSCNTQLTLTENRILASAEYFEAACKAGPWVKNDTLDAELKRKYPTLCALCGDPATCSKQDKYWGRQGSLFCLTDGAGDLVWARLDDIQGHFGLAPGLKYASPDDYSLLCPDGTLRPLNTTNPCIWVAKPWPVVASKRTIAQDIRDIVSSLNNVSSHTWQEALRSLLENYFVTFHGLDPVEPIEGYLDRSKGFLSANSFTGCHPPRTIRVCTKSIIETAKCDWLGETAMVNGIEPDINCIKADNTTHCMQALNDDVADVVLVEPDLVHTAIRDYKLKPLFYETVNDIDKHTIIALVRASSTVTGFKDLIGRSACFPVYDGVAWNAVAHVLNKSQALTKCPLDAGLANFFGPSCTPGLPKGMPKHMNSACGNEAMYKGEAGAIRCLIHERGDVAFVSEGGFHSFLRDPQSNTRKLNTDDFRTLRPEKSKSYYLSWSPAGQAMIRAGSSDLWVKDAFDVFLQMDALFGRDYTSVTNPFTMYGLFDGVANVLFHDKTQKLRNVPYLKNTDRMNNPYNVILDNIETCNSSSKLMPLLLFVYAALAMLLRVFF